MQFSTQFPTQWRLLLRNLLDGWLGRAFPSPTSTQTGTPSGTDVLHHGDSAQGQLQPPTAAGSITDCPDNTTQPPTITPAQWLASLATHTSIVVYIDQVTCQIMEMLALSRKQLPEFVRNPAYTDEQTRWLAIGQTRLRRVDFTPATAFQQQEDALGAVEDLLSARWHASTQLMHLDQDIQRAFAGFGVPASISGAGQTETNPAHDTLRAHLAGLLASRQVASDELAKLDESAISVFQRLGMAAPELSSNSDLPSNPA